MNRINTSSNSLYNEDMKNLEVLQQFNSNTLHTRLEVINLVVARDASLVKQTEENLKLYRDENNEFLKSLQETELSVKYKDIFTQLNEDLKEYRTASDKVVALVSQQNYDDAMELSKQIASLRNKLTTSIDKLTNIIEQQSENKNNSDNLTFKSSYSTMVIIVILGFVLAAFLGTIISIGISKQLKLALSFAKALEQGDLTHNIAFDSKDEVGTLINALNKAGSKIRSLIAQVTNGANHISSASQELSATAEESAAGSEEISGSIS